MGTVCIARASHRVLGRVTGVLSRPPRGRDMSPGLTGPTSRSATFLSTQACHRPCIPGSPVKLRRTRPASPGRPNPDCIPCPHREKGKLSPSCWRRIGIRTRAEHVVSTNTGLAGSIQQMEQDTTRELAGIPHIREASVNRAWPWQGASAGYCIKKPRLIDYASS
ncbi:hypothetical protein VTK56DRAFT_9888 [Thermocarpiscus australiensis]